MLALAALSNTGPVTAANLFHSLRSFSLSFATSLRPLAVISIHAPPEEYTSNLNQAYAAIKLWLLLCRKMHDPVSHTTSHEAADLTAMGRRGSAAGDESDETRAERRVWNELWPPFENMLLPSVGQDGVEEVTVCLLHLTSLPRATD